MAVTLSNLRGAARCGVLRHVIAKMMEHAGRMKCNALHLM